MNWIGRLWQRRRLEEQLQKELLFHIEEHTKELVSRGLPAKEAQRQAKLAIGGIEQVKENCRDARGTRWLGNLSLDVRYALRTYRRSPGFTFTVLFTIALGIGTVSAVFSVADRILFRSLPYSAGNQLVSFGMQAKVVDDGEFLFAADYKDLSSAKTPFQSIASWTGVDDCDVTQGVSLRQRCAEVGAHFLTVLGVRPILGEAFTEADTRPGAPHAVMLGYGMWQSRFGSDRGVVGKLLTVDGVQARIVGVLPATFELPTLQHADLLTPQIILPAGWQHGATRVIRAIARLKDGTGLRSARSELEPAFRHMLSYVPPRFQKEVSFRVRSLRARQIGDAGVAAWTLLGAVFAVMLICCANVANLLLARMAARKAELAIRNAIGIGRGRQLCQLLAENLILSVVGGMIGCALGAVLLRVVIATDPYGLPHLADASLDRRVLLFSLALSLAAACVFSLTSVIEWPSSGTLGSSRGVTSRSSTTLKNTLVAGQIALSIVLLGGAGLLTRSLWNMETQPLGMKINRVLTAQMVLPTNRYPKPEERIAFFNQVERRLGQLTGVDAVGLSDSLPPGGWERSRPFSSLQIVGHPREPGGTGGLIDWRYVSPGYFAALHIPVLMGRAFSEGDRRPGVNLCLLSRSLERRLFPMQTAVGQDLKIGTAAAYEIVGVVSDVKNTGLSAPGYPEYYILRTHSPDDTYLNATGPTAQRTLSVVLQTSTPYDKLTPRIRQQIGRIDPTVPVEIQSMSQRLGEMTAGPRLYSVLLVAFAGVGLLLAAIGLYGTISYLITQRTQEIGIRMALGATPWAIGRMMILYAAKWTLTGSLIGLLGALASGQLLTAFLYRVSARDPLTLILALACLLCAALLATISPLRRAVKVDPAIALRNGN